MAIPKNIKTKNYMIIALIVVLFICTNVWAETGGQSMSTEGISLIAIKTANSTFRISAWERPEVAVSPSSENSIELLKIEKKDDRIEIEASKSAPDMSEFNISIPEDMNLEITSMNGSIYVTGINGKKKIETFNGNVEMSDVVGSISAKTFNGNIVADIRFDEKSDFNTVNGSIDIRVKDEFSVPISANTVSGNITMTLPDGYSAEVDASTLSGQIFNELPLEGGPDGHSLKGKIFNGGPPLKLKTISGTINIKSNQAKSISISETSQKQPEMPTAKTEEIKTVKIDKSSLPIIEATRTLNPPVIDGRLDDKAWKSAGKIENFVWADGIGKPFEATEAYLLWDDQNLYIGIRCYESNMDKIKISVMDNDKQIWADENVQILIDPTPETETNYYHIAINPIGTVFDQEVSNIDIGKRRTYASELGMKWNFGGNLGTDMRDNSWSIEVSIPISSLTKTKPKEQDIWRFNLHRMEQQRKEYTYWSPTYSTPDWPHVPSRFGKLLFSGMPSLTETPEESLAPTETELDSKIVDIIIEGNQNISKDEIMESLKLKIGDIADIDSLSRAKQRLESLGWFQNIGMDLVKNNEGVELMVNLIEKEIVSPSAVVIEGSTVFSKEEIIKYFNLTPAKTTKQDIDIKCKLIPEIFKSREFDMATAKYSIVSNVLNISIDEGRIDKVEIYGNKKIQTEEIMKHLNLKPGMPYKRSDINDAINAMRYKLPYFDNVNWDPKKSADGLNIVHIEVKENNLMQFSMQGASGFDRVHGLQLGFKPELKSIYWGSKVYFGFSYGFSSEIWNYQFGAEKSWFREHKTTIGVDVHKMTDTNDHELISDKENFIAEAILGEAFRDFYQREGYEVSLSQEIPYKFGSISVKYRDDEYGSLSKTNDWSLLNRFYADEEYDVDKDVKYKRENPSILEGRMKSVIGECVIDTRNNKKETTNGWYNTFSVEYAGNELGGNYEFKIYQANIRRYNRISGNQLLALRVKAGTSDRELPRLHPRKFYLGGIGTLRGYDFKKFEGDKMLLINAEYWLTMGALERTTGFGLMLFADSGYAWNYNSEIITSDLKTDVGVGISFGSPNGGLIVNLATPIEEGNREPVVSVRLNRMF